MKHVTIAGNWKMHQTPEQAVRLLERLQQKVQPHTHVTNVLCVPAIDLTALKDKVEADVFKLGAQNLNEQDEGAFTGEISGSMLHDLVDYVIVGHSERRQYEHEDDKRIALKLAAAIRNTLQPILCVGENLTEREHGHAKRVVVDQLHADLKQLGSGDARHLLIAYEPIWAIGTGRSATPEDVEPVIAVIRQTMEELFGEAAGMQAEVLYGGSVNPDNAEAFLTLGGVNGLLVGGASLNYEQFAAIIATAGKLANGR